MLPEEHGRDDWFDSGHMFMRHLISMKVDTDLEVDSCPALLRVLVFSTLETTSEIPFHVDRILQLWRCKMHRLEYRGCFGLEFR